MIHYDPKFETQYSPAQEAARKLHPEDICIGDYVAISDVTYEYASFLWNWIESFDMKKDQAICINFTAHEEFDVYRVQSICLPFVHTIDTRKKNRVFDLRKVNLFRLSEHFAKSIKKRLKQAAKKQSKKKQNKKKGSK